MSASADRPVVDDTTEGFVGIGTTHGPGAGEVVRLLAGAIQIGTRRSGEAANSHVAIGAPITQAGIALELNDRLFHLGRLVEQQQRTTLVGRDAIGHETAREATPVALNIFAQVWDVELQRAVARHLIIYIAIAVRRELRGGAFFNLDGEGIGLIAARLALGLQVASCHDELRRRADTCFRNVGSAQVDFRTAKHGCPFVSEELSRSDGQLSVAVDDEVIGSIGSFYRSAHGHRALADLEGRSAAELSRTIGRGVASCITIGTAVEYPVLRKLNAGTDAAGLAAILQRSELQHAIVHNGSTSIGIAARQRECSRARLVDRGSTTDSSTTDCEVNGLVIDDSGRLRSLSKGELGICCRSQQHVLRVGL